MIIDPGQDRLILELYVWIAVDPGTHLEGICSISLFGKSMQAVSSSLQTAMKLHPLAIDAARVTGKRIYLAKFTKVAFKEN